MSFLRERKLIVKKKKQGSVLDMFQLVVVVASMAFILPMVYSAYSQVNQGFNDTGALDGVALNATTQIEDQMSNGMLDYYFLLAFIGVSLVMILFAFLTDAVGPFMVIYIIISSLFMLVAVPMSNAYHKVMLNSTSAMYNYSQAFPMQNYIMDRMPTFMAVIGFITFIAMFAKWRSQSGGSL